MFFICLNEIIFLKKNINSKQINIINNKLLQFEIIIHIDIIFTILILNKEKYIIKFNQKLNSIKFKSL